MALCSWRGAAIGDDGLIVEIEFGEGFKRLRLVGENGFFLGEGCDLGRC